MNTSIIRNAIANKELIEFTYQGYPRLAEPHVYGIKNGKRHILVYQIGGLTSSGKIPDWRLVNLDEISGLRVIKEQKFAGPREKHAANYEEWDTVIASAK
jgi:hypothetical protein